jgi:hypothetical protein
MVIASSEQTSDAFENNFIRTELVTGGSYVLSVFNSKGERTAHTYFSSENGGKGNA